MKKYIRIIAVMLVVFALTLTGCGPNKNKEVNITALQSKITLNVDEVLDFNYKSLFTIKEGTSDIEVKDEYLDLSNILAVEGTYYVICTYQNKIASVNVEVVKPTTVEITLITNNDVVVNNLTVLKHDYKQYFNILDNNNEVEVKDEYLDLSLLRTLAGTYKVTCTYQGVTKTLNVVVEEVSYQIKLSERSITIKQALVETYNFNELFTVVVNGKIQEITPDMVTSNVISEVGTYEYKVSLGETSMSLTVNVISDHEIEIINSYNLLEIELKDIETFDYTKLFSVYLDGETRTVTIDMIDISNLNNAVEDEIYDILITYKEGQAVKSSSCKVKIIPNSEILITSKNLVIYPNYGYIDLTTLFTVIVKEKEIPVTLDMISGTIDYAKVGENIIKLNYQGLEKEAIIEVKQGVIINASKGEIVKVAKGISKETYNFASDFEVIVNGIKYTNITSYIDTDNIDFNTLGTYTATISVPYTDSTLGIEKGTIFTKEITYEVVNSIYSIKVLNETVILKQGTTEFNAYDNINVKVNGVNQKLTKVPTQASTLATYAVILSTIDFNAIGMQEMLVDVYVNGPDSDPVRVQYNVLIESNIEINVNKTYAFEGETVYTKDLFTITLNDEFIEVTQDMISGKVNTNKPGVYYVEISYQGIKASVNFIVLNLKMVGTYSTLLTTIETSSSSDEEGYEEEGTASTLLKKLYITEDGQISVNGSLAKILYGIDENTMYIKYNNYEFTLSYVNGIVFIEPNNDLKMAYIETKRPLIYFNEEVWQLNNLVTINSTDKHILELGYNGYSFDIFNITNLNTNETIWYALKIHLYEKLSSDVKYIVSHGEVLFDNSFKEETNNVSSFEYCGDKYKFTMTTDTVGKINSNDNKNYKYANMTFTTTINGEPAELIVDEYEGFILKINGKSEFSVNGASIRNQKYGGCNYDTDTVLIINKGSSTETPYSYKLELNLEDNTFTLAKQDMYFGRYESDEAYIFLDGYGSGLINFDKKQFSETVFNYTVNGNLIILSYVNTTPSFEYGVNASVYIDEFNNTLTPKYFGKESLNDDLFTNTHIIDGAIVNISSYEMKVYTNTVLAKKAFFDFITIYTKDGELTDNSVKKQLIDITDIDFKTAGIYHYSITIEVNGESVVMHYSIQII